MSEQTIVQSMEYLPLENLYTIVCDALDGIQLLKIMRWEIYPKLE